ncbi:tetratricopeptide repeat protein [Hydrogenovibrio halophilus]|uniref:tetratricopeptide repeat protein n=1 Tax=Hydrogenovibrio halophilus TaxID=373391 RepID=UPI0003A0284E|nr:tetratricopeptide repeat protein [Hydrogenovibrio halophilus]
MRTLMARLGTCLLVLVFWAPLVQAATPHDKETQDVEQLEKPMYNPFVERYVMDELRQLRVDMNDMHVEMTKEVVNRELTATSRAVGYATDTVTYFFYLIAGISSVLLLVGWTSIRDIKVKVHDMADTKVSKVIATYEERLKKLEEELQRKSRGITSAQKRLSQHQDIHSLWLKAGQEQILSNRMTIYDQILEMDPDNVEAMTYKADAALEMNEPQWAINLCNQALRMDPENKHAFYQLAGAYAQLDKASEAMEYLKVALEGTEGYKDQVKNDPVFAELRDNAEFQQLIAEGADGTSDKKTS